MAGGRKSKSSGPAPPSRTLVLDNGASTIKAGFVSDELTEDPRIIPNCIARDRARKVYVASDLEKCRDFGEIQFRRPVEKGFIVNWEAQKEIWDREFFDDKAPQKCDPTETRLLLTEQPNSLPILQSNCDQVVFEEYQFASFYRGTGKSLHCSMSCPKASVGHELTAKLQVPRSMRTTISKAFSKPLETRTLSRSFRPKWSSSSTRATPTPSSLLSSTVGPSSRPFADST